jgi:spermidine synthase
VSQNKKLAGAYALECLGAIAGGICATLFLKAGLSNYVIALLCAFAAAIMPILNDGRGDARRLYPFSIIITAILMLLLWKSHDLDRLWTSWSHPNLLETKDSPYSRITSTFRNGQVSVFENDSLIFDTESTEAEEFVHPAALQCRNPKKVLILGGGLEGLIYEAQKHSPKSIDCVEINPVLINMIAASLPLNLQKSLHEKNVHIIHEDPRHYLSRAQGYDLILAGMPEPSSGQTNRFYTQEFFRLCRAGLTEQGVLALRLRSSAAHAPHGRHLSSGSISFSRNRFSSRQYECFDGIHEPDNHECLAARGTPGRQEDINKTDFSALSPLFVYQRPVSQYHSNA